MNYTEQIEKLKTARILIREAAAGLGVPMLEATLGEADMNVHWALWNLGEEVELLSEAEIS